ncbi:hypothetical protein [Streptomyces sp. S584]|uniref:hypothetical protein n=1 Tax=Streptomyces sp. S584 TaxID=3096010 RepID=UPI002AFF1263|nr:hypothetical protein [Streptomyces sp. S584]
MRGQFHRGSRGGRGSGDGTGWGLLAALGGAVEGVQDAADGRGDFPAIGPHTGGEVPHEGPEDFAGYPGRNGDGPVRGEEAGRFGVRRRGHESLPLRGWPR